MHCAHLHRVRVRPQQVEHPVHGRVQPSVRLLDGVLRAVEGQNVQGHRGGTRRYAGEIRGRGKGLPVVRVLRAGKRVRRLLSVR